MFTCSKHGEIVPHPTDQRCPMCADENTVGGSHLPTTNSATDEICADYKSSAYCIWQPTYMRCGVVPCKRERKLRQ